MIFRLCIMASEFRHVLPNYPAFIGQYLGLCKHGKLTSHHNATQKGFCYCVTMQFVQEVVWFCLFCKPRSFSYPRIHFWTQTKLT